MWLVVNCLWSDLTLSRQMLRHDIAAMMRAENTVE